MDDDAFFGYNYRGYAITQDPEDYYETTIDGVTYTFSSYEEAQEYIDDYLSEPEAVYRTYYVSYAASDTDMDLFDYVKARSEAEARKLLFDKEPNAIYIVDCYPIT